MHDHMNRSPTIVKLIYNYLFPRGLIFDVVFTSLLPLVIILTFTRLKRSIDHDRDNLDKYSSALGDPCIRRLHRLCSMDYSNTGCTDLGRRGYKKCVIEAGRLVSAFSGGSSFHKGRFLSTSVAPPVFGMELAFSSRLNILTTLVSSS